MKTFIFFFLTFLLFSCADKNKVPHEIIGPKKMQAVLWDVVRAQILSLEMAHRDTSLNEIAETKALTKKVFDIHKITAADFDQSYDWYARHPELMKNLFDSLSVQKQRENDLELKTKRKPIVPLKHLNIEK
jgi:Domain of unknown function (DUF4296)